MNKGADAANALSRRGFLKLGLAGAAMTALDWRVWAASEGLPAYYGEHLAKVAARLRALSAKCDDAFFFITDLHVPSNRCVSGRILAKLVAETEVKKVLCGGDMPEAFGGKASVDRTIAAYREQWVKAVENAGGAFYPAKGNHDFTIRDKPSAANGFTYSNRDAHDILMDTAAVKATAVTNTDDPDACYYYFDVPGGGIRYIVADTTDSVRTDRTYWAVKYGMGETQLKWLAENAFATARSSLPGASSSRPTRLAAKPPSATGNTIFPARAARSCAASRDTNTPSARHSRTGSGTSRSLATRRILTISSVRLRGAKISRRKKKELSTSRRSMLSTSTGKTTCCILRASAAAQTEPCTSATKQSTLAVPAG